MSDDLRFELTLLLAKLLELKSKREISIPYQKLKNSLKGIQNHLTHLASFVGVYRAALYYAAKGYDIVGINEPTEKGEADLILGNSKNEYILIEVKNSIHAELVEAKQISQAERATEKRGNNSTSSALRKQFHNLRRIKERGEFLNHTVSDVQVVVLKPATNTLLEKFTKEFHILFLNLGLSPEPQLH